MAHSLRSMFGITEKSTTSGIRSQSTPTPHRLKFGSHLDLATAFPTVTSFVVVRLLQDDVIVGGKLARMFRETFIVEAMNVAKPPTD